eukprot:2486181-Pleurochrysis_carterae.AAC.1
MTLCRSDSGSAPPIDVIACNNFPMQCGPSAATWAGPFLHFIDAACTVSQRRCVELNYKLLNFGLCQDHPLSAVCTGTSSTS